MNWLESLSIANFAPSAIVFLLILLGLLVGKIKIFNLQIGLVGVLGLSILYGYLIAKYPTSQSNSLLEICQFLSSFSTSLFISVIGVQAGSSFSLQTLKKGWKALVSGMCVVLLGAGIAGIPLKTTTSIEKDLLLGIFAGGMTSTPALATAQELCGVETAVALGYGMTYWIGLLFIVFFVQLLRKNNRKNHKIESPLKAERAGTVTADSLLSLSLVIVLGYIFGTILPIGNTGGVILSGFIFGILLKRRNKTLSNIASYKNLGLALLLVSAGIPAGKQLFLNQLSHYLGYGVLITSSSIIIGYILIRFVFGFSKLESLIILSGGMTSTPALATLEESDSTIDLSIYALSYTGALIALLISTHILFSI